MRRSGWSRLAALSAVLGLVISATTLVASPGLAYQVPTTDFSSGTTTTPAGLQITITGSGKTSGGASSDMSDRTYQASDYTPTIPSTTPAVLVTTDGNGCAVTDPGTLCTGRGTVTITYEHPVRNPVIHLAGLGGYRYSNGNTGLLTAQLTLTTPGVSISKLSGENLTVDNNIIRPTNRNASVACANRTSGTYTAQAKAGCGSVQVEGTVSSLTFNADLFALLVQGQAFTLDAGAGDAYNFTSTMGEDFGDAPASYDGTNAARHVITDFVLGHDVTEDNAGVANGTSSPNAGPGATGDSDDALATVPPLTAGAASRPYTLSIPYSGASKKGEICGWIDFNQNGTFDNGERACAPASAGGSSVDLTWNAPANLTAGSTYLRLRAGYTNAQVESPTGPSDSGEVEDYQVQIAAATGSISGRAWTDKNRDGIQDADESSLAGVKVELLDASGKVVATATTDADGNYEFDDLAMGDYKVRFTAPDGRTFSPQGAGSDPAKDSDANPATGETATITLTPDAPDSGHNDAGVLLPEPTATPDTTSGPQGKPQSTDPLANDAPGDDSAPLDPSSLTLLDSDGKPVDSITVPGEGKYTIEDGKIVFTPEPSFTGTATPVDYRVADVNGVTAKSTYTPTVTPVARPDETSGPQGVPQSVDPLANDGADGVTLDPDSLTLVDSDGKPVDSVTVPGEGSYTVKDGKIVFTPEPGFTGTATPVHYQVKDTDGNPIESTYTPTVTPVKPTADPDQTSGPQGVPQSVDPLANDKAGDPGVPLDPDSLTLLDSDGHPVDSVTVPGEGTYTVKDGKIVFTPEPQFTGTATPVHYQIADKNGTTATSTYTPTLNPVKPIANPDTSSGLQGKAQSVDPVANDQAGNPAVPLDPDSLTLLDSDGKPVDSVTVPGEGTYTIEDGKIVFTPEPSFSGTATPVDYQVADKNGTTTKSTYTPSVGAVANPDMTSGPQGVPQSVDPLANDGADGVTLDPSTLTLVDDDGNPVDSVTVPGEGTYTVKDGKIVFTPEPQFTGTATPVHYQVKDTDGDAIESTYTPTLDPVTPIADPDSTSGPQGVPQSIDPLANDEAGDPAVPLDPDSLTLLDSDGKPVDSVTVPGEGKYTVKDGKIVFTPEPQFTGTATPVDYRIADVNGTTAKSTYTPTLDPVKPTANPDTTSGPQGVPQSVDPLANDQAGDPGVPLDPDSLTLLDSDGHPVDSVTVPGEGKYTVKDGKIVFTPEPQFTGTATPVRYQIADVNGTTAKSRYTPTLNPVKPTADPDETSGPQGKPQSIDPLANDQAGNPAVPLDPSSLTLLDSDGKPVDSVTVPGEGTYTIEDGKIVFTPEPSFVGTATPVDYRIADVNGTTAKSTYTPTLTPVAQPDRSEGPQGLPQSVDPLANDGADGVTLDPDSLTLVDSDGKPVDSITVPGEGKYTIEDGKIVFTPEPQFTGEATPVGYQVKDTEGNAVESTYTPAVTPVTPTANPDQTSGPQGVPQSIDPMANDEAGDPGVPLDPDSLTLLDSDGKPVDSVTVPGEGKYTVKDGKIVFTPEPQFTGTATPVDYRIADVNGTTATSTYTPTLDPVKPTADPDQTSGPQGVPQSIDPMANDEAGDPAVPLDPSSLTLLDSDGKPVDSVTVPGEGKYTVRDGKIVFTPEPQFTGTATPVDYRIADVNGTTATSTYTPTLNPVTPTANPDTTSGPQGKQQSIDPLANDQAGDPAVPLDPDSLTLLDSDGKPVDSVTVPGEGKYTVKDGKIVFTPEPQFSGTATPVDYQVADTNGTTTKSTYTPSVGTVANPDMTSGPQGVPQSVDPLANDGADGVTLDPSTLTLVDDDGNPVDSVTVPGEGTYTVKDGKIVFTPEPQFTGTATPVRYQVKDTDGDAVESTYTPTLDPVTPVANPDQSSGLQGIPQSVDPLANDQAGDPAVPLDPDSLTLLDSDSKPVDSVTVPGEGKYTVKDGKIVFTPEPQFTGTATPVDYQVADTNGTTTTSTYTPTVTPVSPRANPDTTSGPQGKAQSIDPLANDQAGDPAVPLDPSSLTLLDGDGKPVDSVTIPGQGTYTIKDGKIVFTPEPSFVGTATPVSYQIADVNGTTTTSTYTPTLWPDQPGIALEKSTGAYTDKGPKGGSAGDTLVYRFKVTNTGNTVLKDITIDDPMLGGRFPCGVDELKPGQSAQCDSVTYVIKKSDIGKMLENHASVTAVSPQGTKTSAAAQAAYDVPPAPGTGSGKGANQPSGTLPDTGTMISAVVPWAAGSAIVLGLLTMWTSARRRRS